MQTMKKIFIDPGHGGSDPGAAGHGLLEKDITLAIAQQLKVILNQDYTGHVLKFSREIDRTVSLRERTSMANDWQANYLLSIHVNAGGGIGFESFIYNNSQQRRQETEKLQPIIHNNIIKKTNFANRGMKEANFHMLRESRMPALLTENGFIDHKNDAQLLKRTNFIRKIAQGHAAGLAAALQLASQSSVYVDPQIHIVKKGDTLWSIAQQYKTTVDELKQLNNNIDPRKLPIGYQLFISQPKSKVHTIEEGDTLWSLAITYKTTVKALQDLNPQLNPKKLTIGKKINLP